MMFIAVRSIAHASFFLILWDIGGRRRHRKRIFWKTPAKKMHLRKSPRPASHIKANEQDGDGIHKRFEVSCLCSRLLRCRFAPLHTRERHILVAIQGFSDIIGRSLIGEAGWSLMRGQYREKMHRHGNFGRPRETVAYEGTVNQGFYCNRQFWSSCMCRHVHFPF